MLSFWKYIALDAGSRIHSAALAVCYVHTVAGGGMMLKVLIRKSLHEHRTELLLHADSPVRTGQLDPYNALPNGVCSAFTC